MPAPEILGSLILKLIGSMVGSVLALIFAPPRNMRDFRRRGSFSLISGVFMTPVVRHFVETSNDPETVVAVAAITAFASWWAAGTFLRIVRAGKWGQDRE